MATKPRAEKRTSTKGPANAARKTGTTARPTRTRGGPAGRSAVLRGPLNVLFIGNSFTARNDLPGMVARLAAADGRELRHRLISIGGASLRTHWNKGEAADAIRTGRFDAVVLQEQSTLPVKNAARVHENVRLFDAVVRDAGTRTVLYLTWARRHAPESQRAITDAYTTIARELGAEVIPAGVAWETVLGGDDPPTLHDRDGSHPTAAGTYLAACCAYAVLFGRSPAGNDADVAGVPPAVRAVLQEAARAAAGDRPPNPRGRTEG